ncbi:MAG TPA: AlwI family type II restriction endonuclease [Candidatus Bathyarchaeia archaeon]|nr:AlwI family type II restriction endonuclease [Candidatus Bathyarchaeia archaeon]
MPKRPDYPHWHANKRWTNVEKTRLALSILAGRDFAGKPWRPKQIYYKTLLQKKKLVVSKISDERSSRAILATFEYFGLAWVREELLTITPAGALFVNGKVEEVLRLQLLKWQYPNPYEAQGHVAPYTRSIKLFPFRTILYFLTELGSLHERESALFVWRTMSAEQSELDTVRNAILDFRKLDARNQEEQSTGLLYTRIHEYEEHLRPYILATGLCTFDPKTQQLSITPGKEPEVKSLLSERIDVKTDWRDEEEWFEYFGDTSRDHPPQKVEIKLQPASGTASGFVVKVKEVRSTA